MLGDESHMGILEMAVADIFHSLEEFEGRQYSMKVSFLEIYNEVIRDLLCEEKKELKIRSDPAKGGVFVECTEVAIAELDAVMSTVRKGERHIQMQTVSVGCV